LESLVEGARHFLGKAMFVDIDRFFVLTNKIRASLPDEVKKASRITRDSEKVIDAARQEAATQAESARAEAARIIEEAKKQASKLVDESEIHKMATAQATGIISSAEETAQRTRNGADDYAREVLAKLENIVADTIGTIQRGKEKLKKS
jgi:vacuolar-type H+-ATPase subunit H